MPQQPELEFALVSSDYTSVSTVSKVVKTFDAKALLLPTANDARSALNRKKIDGLFVDIDVPGAIGLIESTRKGTSNSKAVIYAFGGNPRESPQVLACGANFFLRKPLTEEAVALHIQTSKELLKRERRRFFRHDVNLNATLRDGTTEQPGRITNLSGGGMAVRTGRPLRQGATVDFRFELSPGMPLSGKGQVAWMNADGMAGIVVQMLRGKGKEILDTWLAGRERILGEKRA